MKAKDTQRLVAFVGLIGAIVHVACDSEPKSGDGESTQNGYCDDKTRIMCQSKATDSDCAAEENCEWSKLPSGVCELEAPCWLIETQDECEKNSMCEYSGEYGCDFLCAGLEDEAACSSGEDCLWKDDFCLHRTEDECDSVEDETACATMDKCQWMKYGSCELEKSCSDAETEGECKEIGNCEYDSEAELCKFACKLLNDETACKGKESCKWEGGDCVDLAYSECNSEEDESSCTAKEGCRWDIVDDYETCYPKNDCWAITLQSECEKLSHCQYDKEGDECDFVCYFKNGQATCESDKRCEWEE